LTVSPAGGRSPAFNLSTPGRAFVAALLVVFVGRCLFAALTTQFHIDGDNTVSLLQANDWLSTPQRSYFWGQDYMGTTEVWLFSLFWRTLAGKQAVIPLWYWAGLGQLLFAAGAALVYAGLVNADQGFWSRPRLFALFVVVFGVTAPVFQKYTFGIGHGYSSTPFYAGLAIASYLFRERAPAALFLAAGLLLGQAHFIFRLHLVLPVALVLALVLSGPKSNARAVVALGLGVALGMLPEKLLQPAQGYEPAFCLTSLGHFAGNAWQVVSQAAAHVGTLPQGLLESEHALWFVAQRPVPADWTWWGARAGVVLLAALTAIELARSIRSARYLIFPAILLVNLAVLVASCLTLDEFSARRYLYVSLFSVPFLMMHPPWTLWHRVSMALRLAALALYVVSALAFRTPLAQVGPPLAERGFDVRFDCLAGSGSHLSALLALHDWKARTVDLDWRLYGNYSRNVGATPAAVRDSCRQLFWIDANGRRSPAARQHLCESPETLMTGATTGLVSFPSTLVVYRCRIPKAGN